MDFKTAAQEIHAHTDSILDEWLEPAKEKMNGKKSYICPICSHGANGDGLGRNPNSGSGLKCFGCGFSGDVIDLYAQAQSVSKKQALNELAERAGIQMELRQKAAAQDFTQQPERQRTQYTDYSEYNAQAEASLFGLADKSAPIRYIKGRGISLETAQRAEIGYNAAKKRIIFPTVRASDKGESYEARAIDESNGVRWQTAKNGGKGLFNPSGLYTKDEGVFICEGGFDALAIMEAGKEAVALCSTSNIDCLMAFIKEQRPQAVLYLCLDNDEAGRSAEAKLAKELHRAGVSYVKANISGKYKDAAEHLQKDRDSFLNAINDAAGMKRPDNIATYIRTQAAADLATFKSEIKTGFSNLDERIGGLYSGLYVLGAISSLGKTTFIHQLADQIAAQGQEVIFFSLEQSRLEMVSKSLAREMAKEHLGRKPADIPLLSSIQLRRNGFKGEYAEQALKKYLQSVGDRLSIVEGNFNCTASYMGDYVRGYIERTGSRPVVIVDYLQVIPPDEQRRSAGAKEKADAVMVELKQLSRELNLCLIVISSVNRANYYTPINFESFKESGGIEYTADVVMGMQLSALSKQADFFESQDEVSKKGQRRNKLELAKAKDPREIELVILKNRFGSIGRPVGRGKKKEGLYFLYHPKYDYFEVDAAAEFGTDEGVVCL